MVIHIESAKIVLEKEDGTRAAFEIGDAGVTFVSKILTLSADEAGNLTTTVPFAPPAPATPG